MQILLQIAVLGLQLKNFTFPRVTCKEKADPCKFLAVEKFVERVIMLTRVGTFSIILIIDRSRSPGSLQPLGSFLFTGVAVKELTSPTSLRHRICQNTVTMLFNISRITFTVLTFRVHCQQGLALNSEEATITEIELTVYLLRR